MKLLEAERKKFEIERQEYQQKLAQLQRDAERLAALEKEREIERKEYEQTSNKLKKQYEDRNI